MAQLQSLRLSLWVGYLETIAVSWLLGLWDGNLASDIFNLESSTCRGSFFTHASTHCIDHRSNRAPVTICAVKSNNAF